MIVVRVELHSAVTGQVTEIARAIIANKGGTAERGDYDVATFRGRDTSTLNQLQIQRRGKVENHARLKLHVWYLVAKALRAMGYGNAAEEQANRRARQAAAAPLLDTEAQG